MRMLPFFKPKKGFMMAGGGLETSSGGGGGGGGGSAVDYSTTETDTGVKWIDGKKVYRKVIVANPVPGNGNPIANIPNVAQMIKMQSIHKQGAYTQWYNDIADNIKLSYNTNGNLQLNYNGSNPENGIMIVIVEYTKTTN